MNENRESLLHKIKRLYTEVFLVSLHNRIDSYHSLLLSDKHHDISDVLHELIDEIVKEAASTYSVEDYRHKKYLSDGPVEPDSKKDITTHSTSMVSMTLNGLSVYLKKESAQKYDPHMSARLQQCVWDHVHSAHRFARLGDAKTAKLHADIAVNAMKTLSCYMSSDEYTDFFNMINDQLQA